MKNVYKVSYDIKFKGDSGWASGGSRNGWSSRNVIANGDARSACEKMERHAMKMRGVAAVRILSVERVAEDVL